MNASYAAPDFQFSFFDYIFFAACRYRRDFRDAPRRLSPERCRFIADIFAAWRSFR